jgi:hypothetical protein
MTDASIPRGVHSSRLNSGVMNQAMWLDGLVGRRNTVWRVGEWVLCAVLTAYFCTW